MILQSLNELYERLAEDPAYEIAPAGYSPQKIAFRIVLTPQGEICNIEDARLPDEKGKLQNQVLILPGEAKPSGSGLNPCILWDNTSYLLGYKTPDKDAKKAKKESERALKAFQASRDKHLELEQDINCSQFSAVCRFFEKWLPEMAINYPVLLEPITGFGIFQIQGQKRAVHESELFNEWWLMTLDGGQKKSEELAQCMLSGRIEPIARLHQKLKSVTGAQSSGASLVSFNANSYESYAKTQSFNAPVGQQAAFQYTTALNSLLCGPKSAKHRLRVGDSTTVFWTDKPTDIEDVFAEFFSGNNSADVQDEGTRDKLERLLKAVTSGQNYQNFTNDIDINYHILGLAPNAARISVRFYYCSTVKDLLEKLHDHQQALSIIRQFDESNAKKPEPFFPAIWQLLKETAREIDEVPPLLSGAIARAIVQGTPYPEALFSAIIRRIGADRQINYLRAAMLKAILVRNYKQTIPFMLDQTNNDPAYLLGRLFSVLEKTQEDALGDVNSGVRERYYSAASATPASVFPRILRTYQHHLSKLSGGARVNRERLVQDIIAELSANGFPKQLSLKNQGVFAIGYYHQRKDFFTKKTDS